MPPRPGKGQEVPAPGARPRGENWRPAEQARGRGGAGEGDASGLQRHVGEWEGRVTGGSREGGVERGEGSGLRNAALPINLGGPGSPSATSAAERLAGEGARAGHSRGCAARTDRCCTAARLRSCSR